MNQECKKCLLSHNDDENISFDSNGICNYCNDLEKKLKTFSNQDENKKFIERKISEIKLKGKNKKYDCIIGVSGGIDSTYLAYWAYENKLRPLVVHFDNGWNSELAVKNIQNICHLLKFELYTVVIDWEEFKGLQLAYLKAGVIDIEVLTDHAIFATLLNLAHKFKVRYSLNGFNLATEGIMPRNWVFDKYDFINIKSINNIYGHVKIKKYPHLTIFRKFYYQFFNRIESVQILNYISYNKFEAKKLISEKLNWVDYGGKHYESVFTKFYQAYILPEKFKVDKRKAHLSTLIVSGQITKEDALLEIQKPLYASDIELNQEREYVLKKFDLNEKEFENIMHGSIKKHSDFKTEKAFWDSYFKLIRILRPWKK